MIVAKDSTTITINNDYFKMIPSIHKEFQKKLQAKQKEIENNSQKVQCVKCGKKRDRFEIGFVLCDCQSDQVKQETL